MRSQRPSRVVLTALALGLAAGLPAACSSPQPDSTGAASEQAGSPSAGQCDPASMKTVTPDTFTVGTDSPAYEPWFVDNDPTNGKGYESAVAYAVAEKLGYTRDQVKWEVVTFNQAIAPGVKNFDVDVNQISITDERRQAVDFSSGYYDVTQAVITIAGSKIAGATTVADLKDAKLGAQVGSTSLTAITDVIAPTAQPQVYNDNDQAKQALVGGLVDGLVVDLPTAFYITAAELDDGVLVGQLPDTGSAAEQFGLVLDLGSSLTPCVTQAVDALRADGTLATLQDTWLASAGAPVLK